MTTLDEKLRDLLEDGDITLEDAGAVQDFQRFLAVAERREDGKLAVPKEWMPYALGKGPAPDEDEGLTQQRPEKEDG